MITILTAVLAAALFLTTSGDGLNAGGPSAAATAAPSGGVQPTPAPDALNAGGPS